MSTVRAVFPLSVSALVLVAGVTCGGGVAGENEAERTPAKPFIPLHGPRHYIVKFMGITCGHMVLESRLDTYESQPVYHIILTARNSKFFNRIYKIDARIDSWVDVESKTTVAYESFTVEKGETSSKRYDVSSVAGTVVAVEDDQTQTMSFAPSAPVLDPLAYVFRLQALAREPGDPIALTLLTTDGAVETMARVGETDRRRTARGPRHLLEVRPMPADGEMFSRKGEVSLWIDPADEGRLYILDFKLSFGHLVAKLN